MKMEKGNEKDTYFVNILGKMSAIVDIYVGIMVMQPDNEEIKKIMQKCVDDTKVAMGKVAKWYNEESNKQ